MVIMIDNRERAIGALVGLDGIPQRWIDTITDSDEIIELATKLYNRKK